MSVSDSDILAPKSRPPEKNEEAPVAELVLLAAGVRYKLRKEVTLIGRHPKSDVVLEHDERVSRLHAEIRKCPEGFALWDKSHNGSFVNGEKVKRVLLRDGDEIRMGKQNLTFYEKRAAPAAPKRDPGPRRGGTNRKLLQELFKEVKDGKEGRPQDAQS